MLTPFFVSAAAVAIAEIGDRTMLLSVLLAARFGRPWPILAGILVATLANHALAATAGYFVADLLQGRWARVAIALSFVAMAGWTLIPDKPDEEDAGAHSRASVFAATAVAFFLVEIGDKTQIATIALAARFHDIALVAAGTTVGMLAVNTPAVFLGGATTRALPLRTLRIAAAVVFLGIGAWTLFEALRG